MPVALAALALIFSATALLWTVLTDPLGSGLGAYEFGTPQEALKSQIEMTLNKDVRAIMELSALKNGQSAEEKLQSLKVLDKAEYQGKKILFITYRQNGILEYDTEAFEKDADTGFWFPTYLLEFEVEDEALAKRMRQWKEKVEGQ